jgi:hypothetical protein
MRPRAFREPPAWGISSGFFPPPSQHTDWLVERQERVAGKALANLAATVSDGYAAQRARVLSTCVRRIEDQFFRTLLGQAELRRYARRHNRTRLV